MSGVQSDNDASPFAKKGGLGKRKDLKLHTMGIEQFLTHIHVAREAEDNSPTKITEPSRNMEQELGQERSGSEKK